MSNESETSGQDPVAAFNEALDAEMTAQTKRGQEPSRAAAVAAVARRNPQLHRDYVVATQPTAATRRMAADAFADRS